MQFSTVFLVAATALTAAALPAPVPAETTSKYAELHCSFAAIILGTKGLCSPAWITQQTLCCGHVPLCPSSGMASTSFPSGKIPASLSSLWPLPRRIMTGTAYPPNFTPGATATTTPTLPTATESLWDPLASAASSRYSAIVDAGGLDGFLSQPTQAPKESCKRVDELVNAGKDCSKEWKDVLVACKGEEKAKEEVRFECGPIADMPGVGVGKGLKPVATKTATTATETPKPTSESHY